MLAKIAARNRFSRNLESFKKYFYQIESIGDRSGKVWLGSSGISNSWPSIVTDLRSLEIPKQFSPKGGAAVPLA